jgi:hypothetical protein
MICPPCASAADAGNTHHGPDVCECPITCPCFHGRYLEQDINNPDVPEYLDALPADDPRLLAYEERVGRKIQR